MRVAPHEPRNEDDINCTQVSAKKSTYFQIVIQSQKRKVSTSTAVRIGKSL